VTANGGINMCDSRAVLSRTARKLSRSDPTNPECFTALFINRMQNFLMEIKEVITAEI
jgi:hypothetical protein